MIIRHEQVSQLRDYEVAFQCCKSIGDDLDRVRRERDALLAQNKVLKSANDGLESYVKVFHIDEEKEKEKIEQAVEETVEDVFGAQAASEFDDLNDFTAPVSDDDMI